MPETLIRFPATLDTARVEGGVRMRGPEENFSPTFRFDRRASFLAASTEDARLTLPVRLLSGVLGLILMSLGLGLFWLMGLGFRESPHDWGSRLGILALFPVPGVFVAYGIDLVGRAISGRPWSRRFWNAMERSLAGRLRSRRWGWIALVLLGGPVLLSVWGGKGPERFELVLAFCALGLHVIVHELGHLVAAAAVGYRPRGLAVGPVLLDIQGSRTRLFFQRSWLLLFGGLATYVPIGRTRAKDATVVLAGPLTNLLGVAWALETWGWPAASSVSGVFLRSFIGIGLCLFLVNLLPLPRGAGGFALDGRELVDLLRRRR